MSRYGLGRWACSRRRVPASARVRPRGVLDAAEAARARGALRQPHAGVAVPALRRRGRRASRRRRRGARAAGEGAGRRAAAAGDALLLARRGDGAVPRSAAEHSRSAAARRAGDLRRGPGRALDRRGDPRLPGLQGHRRVPARTSAAGLRGAARAAAAERVRARADGHRHPPGRAGRRVVRNRPWHRHRDRRDRRAGQPRQALPGRDARSTERRQAHGTHQAPSDDRRRRGDLRQRDDPRRRHGDRQRQPHRRQRVAHPQRLRPLGRDAHRARRPADPRGRPARVQHLVRIQARRQRESREHPRDDR